MLTKGKVVSTSSRSGVGYARVWIPIFNGIVDDDGNLMSEYYDAEISIQPGIEYSLQPGDTVFLGFQDRCANKPVIVGCLNKNYTQYGKITTSNLTVNTKAKLPIDTTIGKVTKAEIQSLVGVTGSIQKQLQTLKSDTGVDLTQYSQDSNIPSALTQSIWENSKILVNVNDCTQVLYYAGASNGSRIYANSNCTVTITKTVAGCKLSIQSTSVIISRSESQIHSGTTVEKCVHTRWSDYWNELEYSYTSSGTEPSDCPTIDWEQGYPMVTVSTYASKTYIKKSGFAKKIPTAGHLVYGLDVRALRYLTRSQKWSEFSSVQNIAENGSCAVSLMNVINLQLYKIAQDKQGYTITSTDAINDNYSLTLVSSTPAMVGADKTTVDMTKTWTFDNSVQGSGTHSYGCSKTQNVHFDTTQHTNQEGNEAQMVQWMTLSMRDNKWIMICIRNRSSGAQHHMLGYGYIEGGNTYSSILVCDPGAYSQDENKKYAVTRTLQEVLDSADYKNYDFSSYREIDTVM